MHPHLLRLLGLAAALGTLACAGPSESERARRAEVIKTRWEVQIGEVSDFGPYRAASLAGEKGNWRLFFPRSGPCAELVQEGARPVYRFEGPFGVLVGEDRKVRCSPVGVGSLAAWRDQQGRRRSQFLQPREQARFRALPGRDGEEAEVLMVHGAFPLALEIRWPEPMDAVAILPATPACRAQLSRGKATMEFRAEGDEVFVLRGEEGPCPILGLALHLAL